MSEKKKLRTYRIFKRKLVLEKYLLTSTDYRGRMLHSRLRNGSHWLELEIGRWKKLTIENRICSHCNEKKVEDEIHFLVYCSKYNQLRDRLYQKIFDVSSSKWNLNNLSNHDRFLILMNGTGDEHENTIFGIVQKYIIKCVKVRDSSNE